MNYETLSKKTDEKIDLTINHFLQKNNYDLENLWKDIKDICEKDNEADFSKESVDCIIDTIIDKSDISEEDLVTSYRKIFLSEEK